MQEQSVIHSTFVIERSYPAKPERVFAAFSDPVQKRRWFAEGDHGELEHHELDFRVGGKERVRVRLGEDTPLKGVICTNDISYLDIVRNRRVVTASTMSIAEKCISASLVTFEFLPSKTGTDLIFTHQGAFFEGSDGPEMRKEGWQELLDKLSEEFVGA
ncbi:MAG: SRPBCC family protein [Bryobacteraceae bacterium]|jgi:uncharacterized protein YndB with AHSA1/START domain